MSRERNNIKAGLFVLTGVTLAFVCLVVLSDLESMFTEMQTVETRFALADGLKGLKVGAPVKLGGVPVGDVIQIADAEDADGVVVAQIVRFEIPAKYKVYENARLELDVPVLGSGTALNIRSFGGPIEGVTGPEAELLYTPTDEPIPGNMAPNEFARQFARNLGVEDEQRAQMQEIIANLRNLAVAVGSDTRPITETLENLRVASGTLKDRLPEVADNMVALTDDVKTVTGSVREAWPDWKGRVDSMLANLEESTVKLDTALAKVNDMLDENRENLKGAVASAKVTLDNTAEITERAKAETMAKITQALDTANEALANMRDTTAELKGFMIAQRPVLERTVGNARIVSDQLKLAAIEIRRSPWRLMYTPKDEELETDNLYDAARSFAMAASSLNSTADSLQAILDRYPEGAAIEDRNVKLMLDNLQQTFGKFTEAERKFWDAMNVVPKPGKPLTRPEPVDPAQP